MLFEINLHKRLQSIDDAIGMIKRGNIILRYLTIAPRLFTLNPIANKTVNEKKRQKYIRFFEWMPFFLQKIKRTNISNRAFISIAAARDSICLTSLGYGRIVESVIACGVFFKKLIALGSN